MRELPADPFVLGVLAPSLPHSLTRLELQLSEDLELVSCCTASSDDRLIRFLTHLSG